MKVKFDGDLYINGKKMLLFSDLVRELKDEYMWVDVTLDKFCIKNGLLQKEEKDFFLRLENSDEAVKYIEKAKEIVDSMRVRSEEFGI